MPVNSVSYQIRAPIPERKARCVNKELDSCNSSTAIQRMNQVSFHNQCTWSRCLWPVRQCDNSPTNSMHPSSRRPGPRLNIKTIFSRYVIPMLKIRRSWGRRIFNMGIPMLVRRHRYFETAPGGRADLVCEFRIRFFGQWSLRYVSI